ITPAPRLLSTTATTSLATGRSSPRSGRASTDGEPMTTLLAAIQTDAAPKPLGHYKLVFVSGRLAAREDGSSPADKPFEAQARQSLANLLAPRNRRVIDER